jgi:CheY-like chemotaxis protein
MTDNPTEQLHGRRILIVEDEYLIAADLAQSLGDFGATVIGPASTVAEAMTLLGAEPSVDAAVLDVQLRGEKTYPIAQVLLARGIRVVFATGYLGEAIASQFAQVPRLEKPVDTRALAAALGQYEDVGSRQDGVLARPR